MIDSVGLRSSYFLFLGQVETGVVIMNAALLFLISVEPNIFLFFVREI